MSWKALCEAVLIFLTICVRAQKQLTLANGCLKCELRKGLESNNLLSIIARHGRAYEVYLLLFWTFILAGTCKFFASSSYVYSYHLKEPAACYTSFALMPTVKRRSAFALWVLCAQRPHSARVLMCGCSRVFFFAKCYSF